ncbi:MAG: Crp/Fnr family transcriptional regulator [Spirochaetales bacterium]|nr:Crp/Fnr family transcriptional regulator [Spirochaetales bacterium]
MDNRLFEKYGAIFDSGKVIFKEGEIGDKMYIIQEGSVRISKEIGGKEHILAVLGKGDFFGEMAIVTSIARTATATAAGTVRLLSFNREGFIGMIEKNARIGLNIIDKLCRRLQQANQQIQHLVRKNVDGLIALNLYYAFAEQNFEHGILEYHKTTREISLNMALPQEEVIKIVDKMRDEGIIQVDENHMFLRDRERLSIMAETAGTEH